MRKDMNFSAFYNAFVTEYCKKLVIFGWMSEGGWKPVLQVIDFAYHLSFITDGTQRFRFQHLLLLQSIFWMIQSQFKLLIIMANFKFRYIVLMVSAVEKTNQVYG